MSSLVLNSIFASLYVTCKHEFSFCYRCKSVVRVIRGCRPFVGFFKVKCCGLALELQCLQSGSS